VLGASAGGAGTLPCEDGAQAATSAHGLLASQGGGGGGGRHRGQSSLQTGPSGPHTVWFGPVCLAREL